MSRGAVNLGIVSKFDNKGVSKARKAFKKFGGVAAGIATGAVAAIGGIATAAARMSSDLEQSFARIEGLVGVSTAEIGKLEQAAIELGPQFGASAQEAADALFFITSAGLRGAEATEVLEASLKASAAGLGDLNPIANAATAAMNTYGSANLSGSDAVSALTEAVRLGQMEAEALSGSLGKVIPTANELGVSFEETTGLVAGLTKGGLTASEAVTGVKGAMQAVLKPTSEAASMLEQYGSSTGEVRSMIEDDGLLATFQHLRESFGENEEDFTRLIGSQEGLNAVLAMTGEASEDFTDIVDQMTDGVSILDEAFGAVEDTAGFKFERAMETAKAALLPVGDSLLEVGASLLDNLMPTIELLGPLFEETFAQLEQPLANLAGLLPGLLEALMPVLPVLGQLAAIFVDLVVALLPPLVALFQLLIPIIGFLLEAIQAFIVPLVEMLAPILTKIIELFIPLIEAILPIFMILLEALLQPTLDLIEALIPFYEAVLPLLADVIENVVVPALGLFAEWLEVWLPGALDFLQNSGLVPFLGAFDVFAASIKNGTNGLEVTIAEMINGVIASFEAGVKGAVRAARVIIQAMKKIPATAATAFALEKVLPSPGDINFGRMEVPDRIFEFPEIDVELSDRGTAGERQGQRGLSAGVTASRAQELLDAQRELFREIRGFDISGFRSTAPFGVDDQGQPLLAPPETRAIGGPVMGNHPYIVGEVGPELFVPGTSGNIIPNNELGGSTYNYNITVNAGVGDPVRIGEEVVNTIKRYERASGPVFASA